VKTIKREENGEWKWIKRNCRACWRVIAANCLNFYAFVELAKGWKSQELSGCRNSTQNELEQVLQLEQILDWLNSSIAIECIFNLRSKHIRLCAINKTKSNLSRECIAILIDPLDCYLNSRHYHNLRIERIIDLPSNGGRWTAIRPASQRHVSSLSNHDVCRCVRVIDIRWNFLHWSHRARGWKLHFLACYRVSELSQNVQSSRKGGARRGKNLFICSPTTCKYPNWVLAWTVFIWHMYLPLSSSCTFAMCRNQVLCLSCLSCVTEMRGFLVITWLCTVNIADCSKCIHATCNDPEWERPSLSLLLLEFKLEQSRDSDWRRRQGSGIRDDSSRLPQLRRRRGGGRKIAYQKNSFRLNNFLSFPSSNFLRIPRILIFAPTLMPRANSDTQSGGRWLPLDGTRQRSWCFIQFGCI
jgi:hypothetical protein